MFVWIYVCMCARMACMHIETLKEFLLDMVDMNAWYDSDYARVSYRLVGSMYLPLIMRQEIINYVKDPLYLYLKKIRWKSKLGKKYEMKTMLNILNK